MNEQERLDQEVAEVEKEYIAAGKAFTSLDVGNELKTRGVNARQRDVSPIVRRHFSEGDLYQDANYTRALIPVAGGSQQAFVYFSIDQDPSDYTATDQQAVAWEPGKPVFSNGDSANDTSLADDSNKSVDDSVQVSDDCTTLTSAPKPKANLTTIVSGQFVASRNSDVMHASSCMYAGRIKAENRLSFNATDQVAQGYRKCMRE